MKLLLLITILLSQSFFAYAKETPTKLVDNINCLVGIDNEYYYLPKDSTENENTYSVKIRKKYLIEISFLKNDSDSNTAVFNVKKIDKKKEYFSLFKISRSFKQEDILNKDNNFISFEMPEVKDLDYQDLKLNCWRSN